LYYAGLGFVSYKYLYDPCSEQMLGRESKKRVLSSLNDTNPCAALVTQKALIWRLYPKSQSKKLITTQQIMHPRIFTATVDRRSVKCLWRGVRKTPARLGVCKFNAAVRRCGNKLWTTVA
jgi:hypothetical protein